MRARPSSLTQMVLKEAANDSVEIHNSSLYPWVICPFEVVADFPFQSCEACHEGVNCLVWPRFRSARAACVARSELASLLQGSKLRVCKILNTDLRRAGVVLVNSDTEERMPGKDPARLTSKLQKWCPYLELLKVFHGYTRWTIVIPIENVGYPTKRGIVDEILENLENGSHAGDKETKLRHGYVLAGTYDVQLKLGE